jgi:hypothetical protein
MRDKRIEKKIKRKKKKQSKRKKKKEKEIWKRDLSKRLVNLQ